MKKIQLNGFDNNEFVSDYNFAQAQIFYFSGCFEEAEKTINSINNLTDFYFHEIKAAIYLERYYQLKNKDYVEKSTKYFYSAISKAELKFDLKRTKFNLLECLNILEKYEDVISTYEEAEKIDLNSERVNNSQLNELSKNSRIELATAYWKTNNPFTFEVFHLLLNEQGVIALSAKDYLIKEFWMEEEEADTYIVQYNAFLSNKFE